MLFLYDFLKGHISWDLLAYNHVIQSNLATLPVKAPFIIFCCILFKLSWKLILVDNAFHYSTHDKREA